MEGTHLIADYQGVSWEKLDNEQYLIDMMKTACIKGNLTILSYQSWKFSPQGVTVLIMLGESHASIHTFPENSRCHIDLYHCGNKGNVYVALNYLKDQLKPSKTDVTIVKR